MNPPTLHQKYLEQLQYNAVCKSSPSTMNPPTITLHYSSPSTSSTAAHTITEEQEPTATSQFLGGTSGMHQLCYDKQLSDLQNELKEAKAKISQHAYRLNRGQLIKSLRQKLDKAREHHESEMANLKMEFEKVRQREIYEIYRSTEMIRGVRTLYTALDKNNLINGGGGDPGMGDRLHGDISVEAVKRWFIQLAGEIDTTAELHRKEVASSGTQTEEDVRSLQDDKVDDSISSSSEVVRSSSETPQPSSSTHMKKSLLKRFKFSFKTCAGKDTGNGSKASPTLISILNNPVRQQPEVITIEDNSSRDSNQDQLPSCSKAVTSTSIVAKEPEPNEFDMNLPKPEHGVDYSATDNSCLKRCHCGRKFSNSRNLLAHIEYFNKKISSAGTYYRNEAGNNQPNDNRPKPLKRPCGDAQTYKIHPKKQQTFMKTGNESVPIKGDRWICHICSETNKKVYGTREIFMQHLAFVHGIML